MPNLLTKAWGRTPPLRSLGRDARSQLPQDHQDLGQLLIRRRFEVPARWDLITSPYIITEH